MPVRLCVVIAAGCSIAALAVGQKATQSSTSRDISELAPEDRMKLKVRSVANKKQALSKVWATFYVITREDIASSGANNVPDLLRRVPEVSVQPVNSNQWAISMGQNLLRPRHRESADVARILLPSQVQRDTFAKLTWRF